jgi:hypothetical protein
MCRRFRETITVIQLVTKFPALLRNQKFRYLVYKSHLVNQLKNDYVIDVQFQTGRNFLLCYRIQIGCGHTKSRSPLLRG